MAAGGLVCAAWYYTIIAGFYILYCPVMYLMFIKHIFYRKVVDVLSALWELYPVALFQWCCNSELHHYGDYVDPNETTIIVLNHRTRVDWNYVWIALYHATQKPYKNVECICKGKFIEKPPDVKTDILDVMARGKSKIKFVLKDELKVIPGMGWIMQLNYFLYVKRNWQEDQVSMSQFVDYYKRLGYHQRVVLFPEGTDLSDDNKRKSQKYALSKQLPIYEFVLHPRTTGWAILCSRLRSSGLASVYDVTLAYDTPAQEVDLLRGKMPKHVYFHFKRYPIEDLPCEEDELRVWLQDRWKEKNISLERFHRDGTFIDFVTKNPPKKNESKSLKIAQLAFLFWSVIDILFIYWLSFSVIFRFWVIYHTLLFIFVTKYFGGFHNIQYRILDKVNIYDKIF